MKGRRVKLSVSLDRVIQGGLLGVARARIEVGGVGITIDGFEVRRELSGRLRIDAPGVSSSGVILPAVELPEEIERAIGHEIEELLK